VANGFNQGSTSVGNAIASVAFVLPKIRSNGFEFDVELLWRIKKTWILGR
jgi:hypothetical protein